MTILTGIVTTGNKRGKKLGFPTLNVALQTQLPEGIYISQTVIQQKQYNSLTFIGAAKTFNETLYQSETYVLNFDQNVYGEEITITLLKKIRDNQKFTTEQVLIEQMEEDKKKAEAYFIKAAEHDIICSL